METLLKRRARVPELILAFKNSTREPFPNWREKVVEDLGIAECRLSFAVSSFKKGVLVAVRFGRNLQTV